MAIGSYAFKTVAVAGVTSGGFPAAGFGTWLGGINNAGEATGYYVGIAANSSFDPYPHAFTYASSVFSPITLTTSNNQATGNGINSVGQVVGQQGTPPIGVFGYVWSPDGSTQTINSFAGGAAPTELFIDKAYGINDAGQVVGADVRHTGFLWQNGAMSLFSVPGASATEAHGINNAGTIVGSADSYGFIDTGGQFGLFGIGQVTTAAAINSGGTVVGSEFDGTHWHGWIDDGTLHFIDAPGAADTWITGINDSNQLSGYFDTADGGMTQGFIATDPPDPITKMVREDYVGLFGRDADAGAQSFWTNLLKAGAMTPRDFVWALTQSPEGQWLHGGQSGEQFVNSVYLNALGRPAEPNTQTAWAGVMRSGAGSWDVLSAISTSLEGQMHFAATHG